jgi:hypothetical protein
MCGGFTLSNSLIFCGHQLGVLEFNSFLILPRVSIDPIGQELSLTRLPPTTSDTSCKYWLSKAPTLLSDLDINWEFSQPSPMTCNNGSQNLETFYLCVPVYQKGHYIGYR